MSWLEDLTKNIKWEYNGSADPWSKSPTDVKKWVPYDDLTNEMIEDALQEQRDTVSIGAYYIDLTPNRMVQVCKSDKNRERPVRRRELGSSEPPDERQARFTMVEKPAAKSVGNSGVCMSPFVNEWIRRNPNYKYKEDTVEKIAAGLLREAELLGEFDQANYLAKILLKNKGAPHDEVAKFCVKIYTKESWVYKLVNTTLRERDMSKVDTLGPFCCFVRSYLYAPQKMSLGDTVYRGMQLQKEDIELYKKSIGEVKSWLAFSSTSRNEKKAKEFKGNTLFVIQFDGDLSQRYPGRDISDLSQYPGEEEVLLFPGADFRIEDVKENVGPEKRTVIYLSLM